METFLRRKSSDVQNWANSDIPVRPVHRVPSHVCPDCHDRDPRRCDVAIRLLRKMPELGLQPDVFSGGPRRPGVWGFSGLTEGRYGRVLMSEHLMNQAGLHKTLVVCCFPVQQAGVLFRSF